MSISSEISRIKDNISSAYAALDDMGADTPQAQNSENLRSTIETIPRSDGTVTLQYKNQLNLNALTTGKELNPYNGAITDNTIRNITDYFPVIPGKYLVSSYYINRVLKPYSMIAVCFYDGEKQYLTGLANSPCVTVPEGAVYARVCGNTYMPRAEFKAQLELSDTPYPTFFEPYREPEKGLDDSIVEATRIVTKSNADRNFYFALPRRLYCTAGRNMRIYHRNILAHPKYTVVFYSASKRQSSDTVAVTVKNFDDYAELIPSGSGFVDIPYAVYDDDFNQILYDNVAVQVTDSAAPSATVLIIGDSTVEIDNVLEAKLRGYYEGTASTLTLLVTRGSAGNMHEGRSGWKAEEYVSLSAKGSVVNAFWDGEKFNFSHYMTQQHYTSVDAVIIQLGINDIFYETIEDFSPDAVIGYVDEMVSSVKAYSDTARIILDLVIPPNSNGTDFTEKYHGTQAEWLYRYNTIRYNRRLTDYYREDSRVTVLGINVVPDTHTDIRDGVHPRTAGQEKIAGVIYDCLANEMEG